MSYCRWSSDNWRCDLYCYDDVSGGITTHIASNRIVGDIPEVPFILDVTNEEYLKAHKKQMDFLKTAQRKLIGLPLDGQTFNDPNNKSFLERLIYLKVLGYNFPDYVLEQVKEDIETGQLGIG